MRATALVIFVLLLNLAMPFASSFHIFSVQGQYNKQFGAPLIIQQAGCNPSNITAPCNPAHGLGGVGAALSTVLVFGDFLLGMLDLVPVFILGVLFPYQFLSQWGVPPLLAAIYTTATWFIYLLFLTQMLSGRPIEE